MRTQHYLNPTTRAQFAVFLAKAMDSEGPVEKVPNHAPKIIKAISDQTTKAVK